MQEGLHFIVPIANFNMRILLILIILFPGFNVLAENFVLGIDDIPIYADMENVDDSLILFDSVNGRFVSSELIGEGIIKDAQNFYETVLPNLGWIKKKDNFFVREKEVLEINYKKEKGILRVLFNIFPKK